MTLYKLLRANHVNIVDKLLYNKHQPVTELLLPTDNYPLLAKLFRTPGNKSKVKLFSPVSPASYLPHILLSSTMNRLAN